MEGTEKGLPERNDSRRSLTGALSTVTRSGLSGGWACIQIAVSSRCL